MNARADTPRQLAPRVALVAAPLLALLAYILLPLVPPEIALTPPARAATAVTLLVVLWWLTEPVPLAIASLLPLMLFPLLGVLPLADAAKPYADPVIYLFFAGLVLGLSLQRWNLHKRIALHILLAMGPSPSRILAGLMLATAFISMWVSNTATAAMMLPIASSIASLLHADPRSPDARDSLAASLVLAVAYAASIGGIATLIGTPPNAILKAYAADHLDTEIGFLPWMLLASPVAIALLAAAWLSLTLTLPRAARAALPDARAAIRAHLDALGPISRAEITVAAVFTLTAALWITRPWLQSLGTRAGLTPLASLTDTAIALAALVALFILPANRSQRLMDWKTASTIPWEVLLLFGGGLSIASAISTHRIDTLIATQFQSLAALPPILLIAAVAAVITFLSEIASNTAVASAIIPVLAAAAPAMGLSPLELLVPATLAASLAFMLPAGTPPNALAYATGFVSTRRMARAGFTLNIIAITLVTILAHALRHLLMP